MEAEDCIRKPKIFRNIPRPEKRRIFIIGGLIFVGILLCILLSVLLGAKSGDACPNGVHCDWQTMAPSEFLKDSRCGVLCTTRPCLISAVYTVNRIDPNTDPCEDFEAFACGAFMKESNGFQGQALRISTYQDMENNLMLEMKEMIESVPNESNLKGTALRYVKSFYENCMSPSRTEKTYLKTLVDVLSKESKSIEGLDKINLKDPHDLMSYLAATDDNPLFQLEIHGSQDSKFRIEIHEQNWDHLKTVYEDYSKPPGTRDSSLLGKYRDMMIKVLELMKMEGEVAWNITLNVMDFEDKLVKAVINVTDTRKKDRHHRYYSRQYFCEELEHRIRQIKWCSIAKKFLEEIQLPSKFRSNLKIYVALDYFEAVGRVLGRYENKFIVDYLVMKLILKNLPYLDEALSDIFYRNDDIFPKSGEFRILDSRWKQCVDLTLQLLWSPLEVAYIERNFNPEKETQVRTLEKKVRNALSKIVEQSPWMEKNVQSAVKKMMGGTSLMIGHLNSAFPTEEKLDGLYAQLSSHPGAFAVDVRNIKQFNKRVAFASDKELHVMADASPFSVFREPLPDSLAFNYGMFSFPMFLPGRPKHNEYSTLGVNILRHMVGLIYQEVEKFLKKTNATNSGFFDLDKCLMNQFAQEEVDKFKTTVNADLQASGKFVDLMSLHGSFEAYKNFVKENGEETGLPGLPFTNEQLFFISYAQISCKNTKEKGQDATHKINRSYNRVNGALSNCEDFSRAFRCRSGSPMNPRKKCCMLKSQIVSPNNCV